MKNEKRTIFISHIHENNRLASLIKDLIDEVFSNAINVFVSSDDESIELGKEWLSEIDKNLRKCEVMLLICSTESICRPWIAFEAGVGWAKSRKVIPLCFSGLLLKDLPMPFSRWQGANVNRSDSINKLLKTLAHELKMDYEEVKWESNIEKYISKFKEICEKPTIEMYEELNNKAANKISIYKAKKGYRFRITKKNGEILYTSKDYPDEKSCYEGVEQMRKLKM